MKIKIIFYCFILLIIEQKINVVNGCTCVEETFEDKYCRADWVARVLITESIEINEGEETDYLIRYTVKFLDSNVTKFIFTSANEGLCGVKLKNETEYCFFDLQMERVTNRGRGADDN
uniref:NTR domain-containing protein n=1 Tax=Meloidogyne hapla TaxID=6305 RepID=A0A1I8B5P0_MELHA